MLRYERVDEEEPWIIREYGDGKLADFLVEMYGRPEYVRPSIGKPVEMRSKPSLEFTPQTSPPSSNGHNGRSPKKSRSAPTQALHEFLKRTGKKREAPSSSSEASK